MLLLTLAITLLFAYFWMIDFKHAWNAAGSLGRFLHADKFFETLCFAALTALPVLFVNNSPYGKSLASQGDAALFVTSVVLSFAISWLWYRYLTWLDIFEKGRITFIALAFLLSCSAVFLVYPMTDAIEQSFKFQLNGDFWNDWWYCAIVIGLVEEIVKIIPFLLILKFTRQVNEPFDYMLYGSVSALGFAFIENIQYIFQSNLTAVYGRAMFSSVAHMFFTSVICYGMVISKHRNYKWKAWALPIFLLLAALAHGFYDFWLINPVANRYYLVTTIFLLFVVHLWVTMKNNLINISSFFDNSSRLNNSSFKYKIILGLLSIFTIAYLSYFLLYGQSEANRFLVESWIFNIYVMLYLAVSFENFVLIQNYLAPIYVPKSPLHFLIPKIGENENHTGETIEIKPADAPEPAAGMDLIRESLPVTGTLARRIVYKRDPSWYVFVPNAPIHTTGVANQLFLIKSLNKRDNLNRTTYQPMSLLGLPGAQDFGDGCVKDNEADALGVVSGKIVEPNSG